MGKRKKIALFLFPIIFFGIGGYAQKKPISSTQRDTIVRNKGNGNTYNNAVIGNNNTIINGDKTVQNKTVVNKVTNNYVDSSRHYYSIIDTYLLKEITPLLADFRPEISREIQDTLKKEFKELRLKYPNQSLPSIHVENGNKDRIEAILQLANVFDQNDLPFYRPSINFSGQSYGPPIRVFFDESIDSNYVTEYINVLACYIPGVYFLRKTENSSSPIKSDPFEIQFMGVPVFYQNSTVRFK